MKKINEEIFDKKMYKTYQYDNKIDIKDILNDLRDSDFEIRKIDVDENVELEMQNISGVYSKDNFFNDQESILNLASNSENYFLTIFGIYNSVEVCISIFPKDCKVNLSSNDTNLEIDDILKKKDDVLESGFHM